MYFTFLFFVFLSLSIFSRVNSSALPQGVFETIVPPGGIPPGCQSTYGEKFNFRSIYGPVGYPGFHRICATPGQLQIRVTNGIMTDQIGRIGAVVANRQIQFDGPPAQSGSVYTGGWSVCDDGTLALGPQKFFFACASGTCE